MLEQQAGRLFGNLFLKLGREIINARKGRLEAAAASQFVGVRGGGEALSELSKEEISALDSYLLSADFDEVALQVCISRQLESRVSRPEAEELRVAARDQLRLGLMHFTGVREGRLFSLTDAIFSDLEVAAQEALQKLSPNQSLRAVALAQAGRVTAAAVLNGALLGRVADLRIFHRFEEQLRSQISALHGEMKLPHAGTSRTVPIEQIYVDPYLSDDFRSGAMRRFQGQVRDKIQVTTREAIAANPRLVILGDPGAGKSTLALKLAHDLAQVKSDESSRTPLLLILRDISAELEKGGRSVVEYLEERCADPYNVSPPAEALDYLLLNGRALVIFDGLDELTETSLRSRVVKLIEGFVHRYPMVPVLVTSRRIGYEAAPLDNRLFSRLHLDDFDEDQVREYADKWFSLDDTLTERDKRQLKSSFLDESSLVRDLRSNPLILSMLCAMYATERYIPRNRPDVYEKCALMLFERWDKMRGIRSDSPFGAQIRSAIQHLAWEIFTKRRYSGTLSRRQIIGELAGNYYGKRYEDENDALDEAERFVNFCTGRAWVLTDVGATETEPRYGFSHRTFLEYFAAEHLVRSRSSSPSKVFRTLRRHLERQEWEVVGQLAVQMLDRNVINGADKFLGLALRSAEEETDNGKRYAIFSFVIRCLEYVNPSPHFVSQLVQSWLYLEVASGVEQSCPHTFNFGVQKPSLSTPIAELLAVSAPEVQRHVAQSFGRSIREIVASPKTLKRTSEVFSRLYYQRVGDQLRGGAVSEEFRSLAAEFGGTLLDEENPTPAAFVYRILDASSSDVFAALLRQALERFGMIVLYLMPPSISGGSFVCLAEQPGASGRRPHWPAEVIDVVENFVCSLGDRTWLSLERSCLSSPFKRSPAVGHKDLSVDVRRVLTLLSLPYLELVHLGDPGQGDAEVLKPPPGYAEFFSARYLGGESTTILADRDILQGSSVASGYLRRWINGEVSTVSLR